VMMRSSTYRMTTIYLPFSQKQYKFASDGLLFRPIAVKNEPMGKMPIVHEP